MTTYFLNKDEMTKCKAVMDKHYVAYTQDIDSITLSCFIPAYWHQYINYFAHSAYPPYFAHSAYPSESGTF